MFGQSYIVCLQIAQIVIIRAFGACRLFRGPFGLERGEKEKK